MLGANCSLQFDWFLASGSVSQQHINKEMTGIDAAKYWNKQDKVTTITHCYTKRVNLSCS